MRRVLKALIAMAMACLAVLWLGGCNTVSGFGDDISAVGDAIGEVFRDASDGVADVFD